MRANFLTIQATFPSCHNSINTNVELIAAKYLPCKGAWFYLDKYTQATEEADAH